MLADSDEAMDPVQGRVEVDRSDVLDRTWPSASLYWDAMLSVTRLPRFPNLEAPSAERRAPSAGHSLLRCEANRGVGQDSLLVRSIDAGAQGPADLISLKAHESPSHEAGDGTRRYAPHDCNAY